MQFNIKHGLKVHKAYFDTVIGFRNCRIDNAMARNIFPFPQNCKFDKLFLSYYLELMDIIAQIKMMSIMFTKCPYARYLYFWYEYVVSTLIALFFLLLNHFG